MPLIFAFSVKFSKLNYLKPYFWQANRGQLWQSNSSQIVNVTVIYFNLLIQIIGVLDFHFHKSSFEIFLVFAITQPAESKKKTYLEYLYVNRIRLGFRTMPVEIVK